MFSDVTYWSYAAERAVKTVAQTAVAVLGVAGLQIAEIDILGVVVSSLFAGLLSLLTSVVNYKKGSK